jgi:single-strand selective monofunctional uracil DNA glycosylase
MAPEDPEAAAGASALIRAARELAAAVEGLRFRAPVAYVYNPLRYAREAHEQYLARYGSLACAAARKASPTRLASGGPILFLGMNPGPWGMAQTGVPFGDADSVRQWLGIETAVGKPLREHPRRPVLGFAVTRGEVSGRRLWSLMRERFGTAEGFFHGHFVANYCPLMFLTSEGRNITPDRLPAGERRALMGHRHRRVRREAHPGRAAVREPRGPADRRDPPP